MFLEKMTPDLMNAKAIRILLYLILILVFACNLSFAYEVQALNPDGRNFITETETTDAGQDKTTPADTQAQPAEASDKYSMPALTTPPISAPNETGPITTDRVIIMDESLQEKAATKEFKVQLKGYRYFKYRGYNSSGNEQNFLSFNGLLLNGNKVEQGTDLTVKASYGKKVSLEGTLYELPYQERDLKFEMNAGLYRSLFGEFQSEFRSGSLATLNKKISGAQLQYTTDKLKMDWVTSKSKSNPKTVTFSGDNTHGPFSLDAYEILENSETVMINSQTIPPDEYTIDYYTGQISFCSENDETECREIKSSDIVQVTFEQKMLLSLSGGNINAMSAQYKYTKDNTIGVSNVTQLANRATERIRATDSYAITGEALLASISPKVIQLPSTGSLYPEYRLLVTDHNFITVKRNGDPLVYNTDYTITYRGYLLGQIVLLIDDIVADDAFEVGYSYYVQSTDYIGEVHDEIITGSGAEQVFTLSGGQGGIIYPGSETVYYCSTTNCSPPDAVLESTQESLTGDYLITSSSNQLSILNSSYLPNDYTGRYIKMLSYLTIPDTTPTGSEYDHTVTEVFGDATVGPASVSFEFGRSEADISKTPIQIVKERLTVFTESVTCPNTSSAPPECILQTKNPDIVDSSDKITFSTSDDALVRGLSYTMEYDTGTIVLTGNLSIAAGTVVYIDYRFNPQISSGIKTGNATRLSVSGGSEKYKVRLSRDSTDTFFTPVGGNNTLETSRNTITLTGTPNEAFNFSLNKTDYDTARDILGIVSVKSSQIGGDFRYKKKKKEYKYTYSKETAEDNQDVADTDTVRKNSTLAMALSDVWQPNLNVELTLSDEKFSDLTLNTDDTNTRMNKLGLTYKKGTKLDLKSVFTSNKTSTSGTNTSYTTRNNSRNIVLSYYPMQLVTVTADIDHQRKSDSRPDQGNTGKDSTSVAITALSVGKFQTISYSIMKQSYPGFTTESSNMSVNALNMAYALSTSLMLSPAYTKTKTTTQSMSSDSDNKTLKLEYRPKKKPYGVSTQREWANTSTHKESGDSDSIDNNTIMFDMFYKFGDKSDVSYKYNKSNESSKSQNRDTLIQSIRFGYTEGPRVKLGLTMSLNNSDENTATDTRNILLESDVALSKIVKWHTEFNMIKYTNSDNASQGYNGHLLETEFRAEF